MNDFAHLVEPVARQILGEPNGQLSSAAELRFGTHGSLSVDLAKGVFCDYETCTGGGVLDLIRHGVESVKTRADARHWLAENGFAAPEKTSAAPAGKRAAKEVARYSYRDENGEELFQVRRLEPKTFRQCRIADGETVWSVKGIRPVPYRLPELLASAGPVFIVEGEKDVDALAGLGLVATCNAGGAGKWRKIHAAHLRGRDVVILPDNDDAGREHAQKVLKTLQGLAASVRIIDLPGLSEKGDASDWLAAGGTAAELLELAGEAPAAQVDGDDGDDEKRRESQADLIVKFALEKYELLRDEQRQVYARCNASGTVSRLGSQAFRDRVYADFFTATGKAIKSQAFSEALDTLRALGVQAEAQRVFVRVAAQGNSYFLDLAQDGNSHAVRLWPGGWEVVERPPVAFVRGAAQQPLPQPVRGGDISDLWHYMNVPAESRLLVLAWLIECLRPDSPYPGLELLGEQGSGKSLTAKFLRRLIDPNAADLRGQPRSAEDVYVVAGHSHIFAAENVSHLAGPLQDAFCVLSTGGGLARRQLYTDSEEAVIAVQRPWIINGISASIVAQDLLDRTVSVDCPTLNERETATGLNADFEKNQAALLGAVLDVAAQALAILPGVRLAPRDRPRLAEYALLGMAVAEAVGQEPQAFLDQFRESRREAIARTLDASPVASAVLELVEARPAGLTAPVKMILRELEDYRPPGCGDAWPRTPKGLGDALRRAAPALRQMDVECRCLGKTGSTVKWSIKKNLPSASRESRQVVACEAKKHDIKTSTTLTPQVLSVQDESVVDVPFRPSGSAATVREAI